MLAYFCWGSDWNVERQLVPGRCEEGIVAWRRHFILPWFSGCNYDDSDGEYRAVCVLDSINKEAWGARSLGQIRASLDIGSCRHSRQRSAHHDIVYWFLERRTQLRRSKDRAHVAMHKRVLDGRRHKHIFSESLARLGYPDMLHVRWIRASHRRRFPSYGDDDETVNHMATCPWPGVASISTFLFFALSSMVYCERSAFSGIWTD